jgi:competence protein ComEC
VDALVVSHLNRDHCGFLPYLRRRFRIGEVIAPASPVLTPFGRRVRDHVRRAGLPLRLLREGDSLAGGGFRCQVLHPDVRFSTAPVLSENDRSLVLRCECRGLSFLLPGDVGSEAIRRLTRHYGPALKSDVLLMPHHGSYHEGLEELVSCVQPALAVVSGTKEDCDARTVELLERQAVPLWLTAADGAITVRADEGAASVLSGATRRRGEVPLAGTGHAPTAGGGAVPASGRGSPPP